MRARVANFLIRWWGSGFGRQERRTTVDVLTRIETRKLRQESSKRTLRRLHDDLPSYSEYPSGICISEQERYPSCELAKLGVVTTANQ
jgi:hypothetical protein